MARPAVPPPTLSHAEWLAAGCPQMFLSVGQLATWIGISRPRTNLYVQRGDLLREKGKIDTAHPRNLEWLKAREGYEKNELQSPGRPPGVPRTQVPDDVPRGVWGQPLKPPAPPPGDGADMLDLHVVLDAIAQMDLSKLSAAAIQKVQRLEAALKTRTDHQTKRGLLIERRLVGVFIGRMWAVDSDQIKPLGSKVAPVVAGLCGVEDAATILQIEQAIDIETHRILAHIKHLMDEFLAGVGAEAGVDAV